MALYKEINYLGLDEILLTLLTIFSQLQIPFLLLKWIYPSWDVRFVPTMLLLSPPSYLVCSYSFCSGDIPVTHSCLHFLPLDDKNWSRNQRAEQFSSADMKERRLQTQLSAGHWELRATFPSAPRTNTKTHIALSSQHVGSASGCCLTQVNPCKRERERWAPAWRCFIGMEAPSRGHSRASGWAGAFPRPHQCHVGLSVHREWRSALECWQHPRCSAAGPAPCSPTGRVHLESRNCCSYSWREPE